ncbi:MAG TPA: NAD-binding protein, partial [Bacteroidota bacterium]
MKIIIMGAGEVGFHLAKLLSQEQHDITVIDKDGDRLARVREGLDVMTVSGNGAHTGLLVEAGIADADIFIAVTSIDEVNFTACTLAHKLGAKKTIIRLDEAEQIFGAEFTKQSGEMGFDLVISPDTLAAGEIVRLIRRSAATDVLEFADGKIQILGLKL